MSDEYTPTTNDVAADYVANRLFVNANIYLTKSRVRDEFDRWLAEHDREVAAKVLERFADQINRVTLRGPDNHMKHATSVRAAAARLAVLDAAAIREGRS